MLLGLETGLEGRDHDGMEKQSSGGPVPRPPACRRKGGQASRLRRNEEGL